MSVDPDDLTPEQRGETPTDGEVERRTKLAHSRFGRLSRMRSIATLVVAFVVALACAYMFARSR